MTRAIRAIVAAAVCLLGLGQSPADAGSLPRTSLDLPGLSTIHPVVLVTDEFLPTKSDGGGGPVGQVRSIGHPQVWALGRLKAAEPQDAVDAGPSAPFALGTLMVKQWGAGTYGVKFIAVGAFVKSNDPSHPYQFEGVALTNDPGALRGEVFNFIGEQTGEVPPPPPRKQSGR